MDLKYRHAKLLLTDRHTKGERPRIVSTYTKKNYLPAIFYLDRKKVALVTKDYLLQSYYTYHSIRIP